MKMSEVVDRDQGEISAYWTQKEPTGFVRYSGGEMPYWTPDGKPITPMQYREEATTDEADEIPF